MSKQTAVEWLQSEIDNKDMGEIPMWIYEFIEQAKEMEKQQIIKFTNNYLDDDSDETVEQFYNKTFNK
jgi:hypothetical protein